MRAFELGLGVEAIGCCIVSKSSFPSGHTSWCSPGFSLPDGNTCQNPLYCVVGAEVCPQKIQC